ncbi:hypothetical protein RYH80_00650 [Halobaculum sp. MBLA0147]
MLSEYDHESLRAALATFGGYGLILLVMTVLLFGLPYLVFSAL